MTPELPAGRRGNGLTCADWGALVDVDPRLAEGLLDRLAAADVAAYVEPAGDSEAWTRAVRHPSRPLDRLWVDAARAQQAREVVGQEVADLTRLLAEQEPGSSAAGLVQAVPRTAARKVLAPPPLPGRAAAPPPAGPPPAPPAAAPGGTRAPVAGTPGGPSEEEVFAQIVAGWDLTAGDPELRRPAHRVEPVEPVVRDPEPLPDLPSWLEPDALPDTPQDRYVPPPPPPLPRCRPQTVAAGLTLVLGLVLLFTPGLVRLSATSFVGLLGLLLTAAGAGSLVYLVRDDPRDGPDDGAIV